METKQCCIDFYQNAAVKLLFGQSMHPGGLKLTKELCDKSGIGENTKVLDAACGNGASAIFLAKNYGCSIIGIDLAQKNIEEALNNANKEKVSNFVDFRLGDAEKTDFENETFDFVIAECSFCLFPDKSKASKEMYRILKRNGKLGLSDVIVSGKLPHKLNDALYKFICIQDAKSEYEYKSILKNAGFRNFYFEDKKDEILNLLEDITKKIFVFQIAKGLKGIEVGIDLNNTKEIVKEIRNCVDKNIVSYGLIIAEK